MVSSALVDVIVPNRNKVRFIGRTLAALRAQTETRWRAIVIDNESDDGSWKIIRAVAGEDSRFEISQQPPPAKQGLPFYRTWNQGLALARAPYVAVLTSDDLWPANWLETAVRHLEGNPGAVAMAGRAVLIDEKDRRLGRAVAAPQFEQSFAPPLDGVRRLCGADCALRALLIGPIFTTIHAVVFRRELLETGLVFAEDLGFAADHEFYLHLGLLGEVVYDPTVEAAFRVYPEQASSSAQNDRVIAHFRTVIERNQEAVAKAGGWNVRALRQRTDQILARHRFILTKPNAATLRSNKRRALRQAVAAAWLMPRLTLGYLASRMNRERFLGHYARCSIETLGRRADP